MTKEIKDYLHLYLGIDVQMDGEKVGKLLGYNVRLLDEDDLMILYTVQMGEDEDDWAVYNDDDKMQRIKPILRPLSDMTEEEAQEFSLSCLNSPHAPEYFDTIEKDELQIEFVKNDGGLMLDGDVELYFNVSCRCLDGYIAIMRDGRIGIANEQDVPTREMQPVEDVYGKVRWLLSKHFDLFRLIESGLAISKVMPNDRDVHECDATKAK